MQLSTEMTCNANSDICVCMCACVHVCVLAFTFISKIHAGHAACGCHVWVGHLYIYTSI